MDIVLRDKKRRAVYLGGFGVYVNEHSCHLCVFQDKVKTLEIELDEERSGTDLMNERITRSREQVHKQTLKVRCI